MKDSAYKISLDIHEHASQAVLKAKKTDTGRELHITLRAGGTPYIIADDCYAAFKATKPDGTILFNACTIENNEIIYEFTEQTCTSVGRCRCEIALYGPNDNIITSPRFSLLVDGTIYPDEIVESADEFSALAELITDTLEATNAATQATQNAVAAAGNADQSAENANKSTVMANQSANAATQAAQNAIAASENANGAAGRANEATNAANDATSNANNAAENANETATNLVRIMKNAMAVGQVEGVSISLDDAVELGFVGCRIFGKTTQGGTPTPDAPVDLVSSVDGDSISIHVCGKNLFTGWIVGGIASGDGSDDSHTDKRRTDYLPIFTPGQKISISNIPNTLYMMVVFYDADKAFISRTSAGAYSNRVVETPVGAKYFRVTVYYSSATTGAISEADAMASSTMIEAGNTYTGYERAKQIQTATISAPNGLRGIPVTSGGNYTDANGQQWICDEIDLARGVYVQRVGLLDFGNMVWYWDETYDIWRSQDFSDGKGRTPLLCETIPYVLLSLGEGTITGTFINAPYNVWVRNGSTENTPTGKAYYQMHTPIETPLSEEELAAYATLYTYRDHTTVSNDAGAYMELEYVMDTKKYIDSLMTGNILPATVE